MLRRCSSVREGKGSMKMLEMLRKGLDFLLMSFGVSAPSKKPAPKPAVKPSFDPPESDLHPRP